MPLTDEEIEALLSKPRRGGSQKAKPIVRDYDTWFKLGQKLVDENTGELMKCSNPDCIDTREGEQARSAIVVEVNGKFMCRFCFLDGYAMPPNQVTT